MKFAVWLIFSIFCFFQNILFSFAFWIKRKETSKLRSNNHPCVKEIIKLVISQGFFSKNLILSIARNKRRVEVWRLFGHYPNVIDVSRFHVLSTKVKYIWITGSSVTNVLFETLIALEILIMKVKKKIMFCIHWHFVYLQE